MVQVLLSATNTDHIVARIGGEEFVVVLPRTEIATAHMLAEAMRTSIAFRQLPKPLDEYQMTASFGVTSLLNDGIEAALSRADSALYQAKRDGRNRVCVDGYIGSRKASLSCNKARAVSA